MKRHWVCLQLRFKSLRNFNSVMASRQAALSGNASLIATFLILHFRPRPFAGRIRPPTFKTVAPPLLGCECDFENACQKSGVCPTLKNLGPQNHRVRRLCNLTATLTAIFGIKLDIDKRTSALETAQGVRQTSSQIVTNFGPQTA